MSAVTDGSEYKFVRRIDEETVVLSDEGKLEVFVARPDGFAGFTVEVDGIDHEFVTSQIE